MHKAAITVRTIYQIHRAKEIPKSMLARLWDMHPERFDQLAHQRAEPWLHEALRIAQTQSTQPGLWSTCVPFSEMVNASQLTRLRRLYADMVDKHGPESAPRLRNAIKSLRGGLTVRLSDAFLAAWHVGLSDPIQLLGMHPASAEILELERPAAATVCPECGVRERYAFHKLTCRTAMLNSPKLIHMPMSAGNQPGPQLPHRDLLVDAEPKLDAQVIKDGLTDTSVAVWNLEKLRIRLDLGQHHIAYILGVSPSQYQKHKAGKARLPITGLSALADVLGCDVADLTNGTPDDVTPDMVRRAAAWRAANSHLTARATATHHSRQVAAASVTPSAQP